MKLENMGSRFSPFLQVNCSPSDYTQKCFLQTVRLKWMKNRGFDHIINKETDIRAVCMLKDIIKKHPGQSLPVSNVSKRQKELGLTIPVLRFMRRFPTIFKEFVGPKYNVPWFRLTEEVVDVDQEEQRISKEQEMDSVIRLCKLLMMTQSKKLSLQSLNLWKWDLGLPDDYAQTLIPKYPDYLSIVKMPDNFPGLKLVSWKDEFAISALQKRAESKENDDISYGKFKKEVPLAYEMNYPRGYGLMNKVKAWMDEWQKLPYISPYEDVSHLDPESDLMEKRVVGVFHELLYLTIHKRTERNNFRLLREEMILPHKFTRIFTRYPGIFYLSLKCAMTSVTLREAYKSGQLIEKHPLVAIREKYFYMMRMGILYRKAGTDRINSVKDRYPCKPEDSRYHDDREQLSGENASINISDSDESIYSGNDYSENYDEEISQEDDDMELDRRVSASGRQSSKKHS